LPLLRICIPGKVLLPFGKVVEHRVLSLHRGFKSQSSKIQVGIESPPHTAPRVAAGQHPYPELQYALQSVPDVPAVAHNYLERAFVLRLPTMARSSWHKGTCAVAICMSEPAVEP